MEKKLVMASKQFLGASIEYIGHVQDNITFAQSVKKQTPVVLEWPRSKSAVEILQISKKLLGQKRAEKASGLKGFVKKLSNFLVKR